MTAKHLLQEWLKSRLSPQGWAWIEEKAGLLHAGAPDKTVFMSFSACSRHAGKAPLGLDADALKAARAAVPGWTPSDWTCDQAARIFLLIHLPPTGKSAQLMDQLYHTADVDEAVALQKALAVLENPEGHMARAREAVRSNIKQVFDAIALRNPYPSLRFDEVGWNQIVVKTFFVESPLREIEGLELRSNPRLSRMLVDLSEERRAAGRAFSPDLWRCVGPCADESGLEALKRVLAQGSAAEKRAAALALKSCPDPRAADILASEPALAAAAGGTLTWENFHYGP